MWSIYKAVYGNPVSRQLWKWYLKGSIFAAFAMVGTMDAVRKAYVTAYACPVINIDQIIDESFSDEMGALFNNGLQLMKEEL